MAEEKKLLTGIAASLITPIAINIEGRKIQFINIISVRLAEDNLEKQQDKKIQL